MILEMQTSVCGNLFAYHAGRQYDVPGEVPATRAQEFLAHGWAVLIPPPTETATTDQQQARQFKQRGREAR